MKKHILIFLVAGLILSSAHAQQLPTVDKGGIQTLVHSDSDTVFVVNFWATWCSPCVKEIGYFEDLKKEYPEHILKVILINLDFPNQVERRVLPFIEEKGLTASIYNVTELDYNEWIPLVDPDWSGAIPATLIFKGEERKFLEKEISRQELFNEVKPFLKSKKS
jgi:thiol-disulfide isomerase/thioredoxin